MFRLRIGLVVAFSSLLILNLMTEAAPQRMIILSGVTRTVPAKGSNFIAAHCVDPHLHTPMETDTYKFFGTGGEAFVSIGGGAELPLANAIKDGSLEIVGADTPFHLVLQNQTTQPMLVRFGKNTIMASDGAQGKELDSLQKEYKDFSFTSEGDLWGGWERRYLFELKSRGFAGTTNAELIKSFQQEFKLEQTSTIDGPTEDALCRFLTRSEGFRDRDPDLGRVLLIRRLTPDDAVIYAIYDCQTARPLLTNAGIAWEGKTIDEVRQRLTEEADKQPPLESIRFDGLTEKEIDGLRNTIQLQNIKTVQSPAYYRSNSTLVQVGKIVQEPGDTFAATLEFVSVDAKPKLTIRSRIKKHVEVTVASIVSFFKGDSAPSIERAVKIARKSAVQAGIKPEDLKIVFRDEAGNSELVLIPLEVGSPFNSQITANDSKAMEFFGGTSNNGRRIRILSPEPDGIRLLASSTE